MRLVDMLSGAGWLLLALFGGQFLIGWNARRARDRAIDRRLAANRGAPAPANRQQRRALQRRARKAGKP
jgi:hypothetical protein